MIADTPQPVLEVRGLTHRYPLRRGLLQRPTGVVRAVDDVSFDIWPGETLGLVGESGCGKTTLGKAVVRLLEPTAGEVILRVSDDITLRAYPILKLPARQLRPVRRHMQIIFQNPYLSLNPRLTVGASITEGLAAGRPERRFLVTQLLRRVGLDGDAAGRYPHAFSGGQLQRICIARAIAAEPALIVCDEVTSALDVSVQAQIINLFADLQRERRVAYLFISHDLKLVAQTSRRVAVMKEGKIVETGRAPEVFANPQHGYTKALLAAVPGAVNDRRPHGDASAVVARDPPA